MEDIIKEINIRINEKQFRFSLHSFMEMEDEQFTTDDVVSALSGGYVLENYPEHRRGPCCLVSGNTNTGRPVHVVCTVDNPVLVIITVYEPKPPKFITPSKRSGKL
ncbi:MAG: DUF4258 domain-containing protein [Ignavibacteria bacterium]